MAGRVSKCAWGLMRRIEAGVSAQQGTSALTRSLPGARGLRVVAAGGQGPARKGSNPEDAGLPADPQHTPPEKGDSRQQTPSSQKTNDLEKGKGAPGTGKDALKPGEAPKRSFATSSAARAEAASQQKDPKRDPAKDKKSDDHVADNPKQRPASPSGRPDPHVLNPQEPQTAGADQRN